MSLVVSIRHRLEALKLSLSFETKTYVTALFLPSGSGKTTVLKTVGSLLKSDYGCIEIDSRLI